MGCKWTIGDGHTVNVWEDFWLADHNKLGPKPENTEVTYVRDLLNYEGDEWDYEKVTSLFPPDIANKITCCFVTGSIPDTLYWHNSPTGQFSCKSAYLLALSTSQVLIQNTSDDAIRFHHAVWKANVPTKVKIFVWRAWNNFVPFINNLRARGLNPTTSSCSHYGGPEDVVHVHFKCSKAKDVWDRCSIGKIYDTPGADTMEDFCRLILDSIPAHWDLFMIILWGLWTRRNKHFHGHFDERDADVEGMAKRILLDYSDANKKNVSGGVGPAQNAYAGGWKKPQAEKIKFNCDAAWQKESGKVGFGFVARDCNGKVLISGAKAECYANSPLEAEAKAIWWATSHARSRGYSNVVFETDSLFLVNALRNQSTPLQITTLFSDILSNSRALDTCEWSFVRREGNMVAHSIASWALRCTNNVILEGEVPDCASALAVRDAVSPVC